MKKFALATIITLSAFTASALEMGVTAGTDFAGSNRGTVGVTAGQHFGKIGVTAGVERMYTTNNDQNRFSLVGEYTVGAVGPVKVAATAGVAYLDNQTSADGFAATVGVRGSVPLNKTLTLVLDARHQQGQSRVSASNGNTVQAGLKFSF